MPIPWINGGELPLWLFETHTGVEYSLLRKAVSEKSIDQHNIIEINKQTMVSTRHRPQCWRDDGGWVEDHVVEQLKVDYW
jgi:hypothetical protein